jgi:hypothetical protein
VSKIKFNLTPQEHIKEIKECGEKFTGSQYYCLYKEDIEKLVKYSEKRDKEIERLNNILTEIENIIEEDSDWIYNDPLEIRENFKVIDSEYLLNKLKELKGSDKE